MRDAAELAARLAAAEERVEALERQSAADAERLESLAAQVRVLLVAHEAAQVRRDLAREREAVLEAMPDPFAGGDRGLA